MTTNYAKQRLGESILNAVLGAVQEEGGLSADHISDFEEKVTSVVEGVETEIDADNVSGLDRYIENKVDNDYVWECVSQHFDAEAVWELIEDRVKECAGETEVHKLTLKDPLIELLRDNGDVANALKDAVRRSLLSLVQDFLRPPVAAPAPPTDDLNVQNRERIAELERQLANRNEELAALNAAINERIAARTDGEGRAVSPIPRDPGGPTPSDETVNRLLNQINGTDN